MNYQTIKELYSILEASQVQIDRVLRHNEGTEATKSKSKYNIWKLLRDDDIHKRGKNLLEKQKEENEELEQRGLENRFITEKIFLPARPQVWNNAIGNLRIKLPKKEEYEKMSNSEKQDLQKSFLKNIVISSAQLANAANRTTYVDVDAYKNKDKYMTDFIAYVAMYNKAYPNNQIAFGFDNDFEKGLCLNASIPGYTRLSVHFGNEHNFVKIMKDANNIIKNVGPKIGFENPNQNLNKQQVATASLGSLPFYPITAMNSADAEVSKIYAKKRKKQQNGEPWTDIDENELNVVEKNRTYQITSFRKGREYEFEVFDTKTGIINCHNHNGAENYINALTRVESKRDLEFLFNVVFAEENFNIREIFYLAERAGLSKERLQELESVKRSGNNLRKEASLHGKSLLDEYINQNLLDFKKAATKKQFILRICELRTCYEESGIEGIFEILDVINDTEALDKEFKREVTDKVMNNFLNEAQSKDDGVYIAVTDYLLNDGEHFEKERVDKLMQYIGENKNALSQILGVFQTDDLLEITSIMKPSDDLKTREISKVYVSYVEKMEDDEIEELFLDGNDFNKDKFISSMKFADKKTRRRIISEVLQWSTKTGKPIDEIEDSLYDISEDEEQVEETIDMYLELQTVLGETTEQSRKAAADVETNLENSKKSKSTDDN